MQSAVRITWIGGNRHEPDTSFPVYRLAADFSVRFSSTGAIPGDEPQPASALLKFARAMPDGSGQVVIIQLSSQGQGVQVVLQIVKTGKPIQAVSVPAAGATPPANEAAETPASESGPSLPEGLPVYPEAQVLTQNRQVLMCQISAPLDQVAKYYQDQMTRAGWTLTDSNSVQGITTQSWNKGDSSVEVILMVQNNQTQIVISPKQ